jgi:hypothetical protein
MNRGWRRGRMYPAPCEIRPREQFRGLIFFVPVVGSGGNSRFSNLIVAAKLMLIGPTAGAYLWDGVPRSLG